MAKRQKMGKRRSRRLFTRTAVKVHPKNMWGAPMRGGIRL